MSTRKPDPSDVTDEEWAFVTPYLALGRRMPRSGVTWRMLPHDLPPWEILSQQTRRWLDAKLFEDIAHEPRRLLPRR